MKSEFGESTQKGSSEPVGRRSVSLGLLAWNEEARLPRTLQSLFNQTLFERLRRRKQCCEILCVVNGCTDATAVIAQQTFAVQAQRHENRAGFEARVIVLAERSKLNAWNQFVHQLSSREAQWLLLMDADIVLGDEETLWRLVQSLENTPLADVAVGRARKDLEQTNLRPWWGRLSLAASRVRAASAGQLCAQLYCIRASVARQHIYLPADLVACEDGFIKALVCTRGLTGPVDLRGICYVAEAEHWFEAYTTLRSLVRNRKRQVMGQTLVHLLVDQELRKWPEAASGCLAAGLERHEREEPDWLRNLLRMHLRRIGWRFWHLYPRLMRQPLERLRCLSGWQRVQHLPAAAAETCLTVLGSLGAYRALRGGCTDYWPEKEPKASVAPAAEGREFASNHSRSVRQL